MSTLGDDEVGLILDWVDDPYARKSLSVVCKQWLRVEGLTRLSIRVLDLDSFRGFIPGFSNLVTFACSRRITDDDLRFLAQTCPKIEALNLNLKPPRENSDEFDQPCDDVGDDGLCALAIGCRKLSKVLLRRRKNIGDVGVVSLINLASTLTNLDLGWCNLITDQALAAIGETSSITILNLERCSLITDGGLTSLATMALSRSLKKLVLAECDQITDNGVSLLQQMYCLEELNMAECGPKITDIGGVAIATIQTLKRLNFSWLINVSDPTLFALAENCQKLVAVDFTGCELITGAGIRAFSNHTCLETLVFPSCYNIGVHDLENVVLGCRSLRCVVLDKRLKTWLTPMMQEYISIFCDLYWR
ncbi:F-box/LRR-repeat protein 4-like [Juglans microcarpa x Juglans regia]|uniref:F-box/LRR-repeat protein 4-like n=1 Tax=Juglans microcarpa x Juglans regia TaxID=2249226 RepID=UPI001B7F0F36|nr:F-box/LRR-repeat protein 4-like [Juglans microcarpa x Juglans regia]